MCQLVSNQRLAVTRLGRKLIPAKEQVAAMCKRARREQLRVACRVVISMNAHAAKVRAHSRLEKRTCVAGQRLTGAREARLDCLYRQRDVIPGRIEPRGSRRRG